MMRVGLIAAMLGLGCQMGFAGLVLESMMREEAGKPGKRVIQYIEPTRIRLESLDGAPSSFTMIYQSPTDEISILDPKGKTYLTMKLSVLTMLAKAAIKMRNKGVKPMDEKEASEVPTSFSLSKKGDEESYKAWKCQPYDVLEGKKAIGTTCIVPFAKLGVSALDFVVLRKFANVVREVVATLHPQGKMPDLGFEQSLSLGVPVKATMMGDKGVTHPVMEMIKIATQKIPPSKFEIPKDYKATPFGLGQ